MNPKLSTDLLDDNSAEHKAERRAEVVEKLEMDFGVNSDSECAQSLRMMCNDMAFEIGLLRKCVGLIEHYAKRDALAAQKLSEGIRDAGLRVLVATTRAYDDLLVKLSVFDGLMGDLCLVDESNEIASSLNGLFERYEEFQNSAMFDLVQSYVLMNDDSVARFSRAIRMDDSLAGHTFLLAKRLSQRGYNVAAIHLVTNAMSLQIGSDAIESIYARYNRYSNGFHALSENRPRDADAYQRALAHTVNALERDDRIQFIEYASTPFNVEDNL